MVVARLERAALVSDPDQLFEGTGIGGFGVELVEPAPSRPPGDDDPSFLKLIEMAEELSGGDTVLLGDSGSVDLAVVIEVEEQSLGCPAAEEGTEDRFHAAAIDLFWVIENLN